MAPAQATPNPSGVDVCTVTGTSGQYSVRVRNTGTTPLARVDVTGVRLDAGGQATDNLTVSLTDIPPGKYKTAILARYEESAALDSIVTYTAVDGAETPQQELFAGKVAHVSPGSAMQYTLAPLAVRGWTVAYGSATSLKLAAGSAVLLSYPVRSGKKPATRPEAGRTPSAVVPLTPCPEPGKPS
nr:hypothetical protein [Achromobacter sp. UMC46]